MAEPLSFGPWLKRRRKALDLTQAALGRQVGCSEAAIRKIEAEVRRPSEQIAGRLADLLGIPASEKSRFLRFARGDWQSAPSADLRLVPWNTASTRPHSGSRLPTTSTSLIGRDREIAAVRGLLAKESIRLVTLVGPPGIGKTRLGVETARRTAADFPDGVFFVALAPLKDPSLIASTVTQSLGYVGAKARSAREQLLATLRDQRLLLVLDNCEHLVEAVALLVAEILAASSHVQVLATSRESLRLSGEWLYPVPPLEVPKDSAAISLESAAQFPALDLFRERARAVRPDFGIDAANLPAVATICAQLDGLPLGIELIAARVRVMSPQALLARLKEQTAFSADGQRAVAARQRTLRDAIGWSYDLLSPEEQALFERLSVFAGSFTLDEIEDVFDRPAWDQPVAERLTSLLDKSLVQRVIDEGGEVRFGLLATLRQFALEQLRRSGQEAEVRGWYLDHLVKLVEQADREIRGPQQLEWLRRLTIRRDDFRAALEWTIETQQTESALSLATRLDWFWFMRSDHTEGRQWLSRVLALPDAATLPGAYAEAHTQLAHHLWLQTGPTLAKPLVEQALAIARSHNDRHNTARALAILGLVLTDEGRFDAAQTTLAESQALFREVQDKWGYAHAAMCLTLTPYRQRDWSTALHLYEHTVSLFRELGDIYFEGVGLRFMGDLQVRLGNVPAGLAALRQALALSRQLNSKYELAAELMYFARAAQAAGQTSRAVSLYHAAKASFEAIGAWWAVDQTALETELEACRAVLDETTFDGAVQRGRAMTLEQAIADALETHDD